MIYLNADLIDAIHKGDAVRRDTLRLLLSALNYKKIDLQHDLSDEEVLVVIAIEAKKRRESIEVFTKNNRLELAEGEKAELVVLEAYLPKQMTGAEIEIEIEKMDLPKDFGQAMKIVAPIFKGRADGKLVAEIVNEKIK
ncbi:MAG: GatB/YqeY domain-containing protein [Candidatus Amesbacteria bacterium]|nr:GatB/YqeY domain-containing protein [Candidatus Amesbacteria bacterium]